MSEWYRGTTEKNCQQIVLTANNLYNFFFMHLFVVCVCCRCLPFFAFGFATFIPAPHTLMLTLFLTFINLNTYILTTASVSHAANEWRPNERTNERTNQMNWTASKSLTHYAFATAVAASAPPPAAAPARTASKFKSGCWKLLLKNLLFSCFSLVAKKNYWRWHEDVLITI